MRDLIVSVPDHCLSFYFVHCDPTLGVQHFVSTLKICNHAIAVYSENKLQHYATAYRNHKSADEKLGLFSFFTYFFSKYITAC